jgi:hypothetical protein
LERNPVKKDGVTILIGGLGKGRTVAGGSNAICPNLLDLFGRWISKVERKVKEASVLFAFRLLKRWRRIQGSGDCGGEKWA